MPEAGFSKVSKGDTLLYGPRKLLLCGFSVEAQEKFKAVLTMAGLVNVPLVWAGSDEAGARLGDLMALAGDHGSAKGSSLDRAVIMAGIKEKELHALMGMSKKAGMKNTLWAALTPTSERWTLADLLTELSAERARLEKSRSS